MDFRISEEQQQLLNRLDVYLDGCGFTDTYFQACSEEDRLPLEFNQALGEAGFGLMGIPAVFGGLEVDTLTMVLLAERLGERGFPASTLFNTLQARDMLAFGTEEQRQVVFAYLRETGSGCFSFGISEPKTASASNNMQTTATHENGKVRLSGHKSYVSNGLVCPYVMVLAREAELEGNAVSMYFVPIDTAGIRTKQRGAKGVDCELFLEDVVVEETALIGGRGNGFMQLQKHMEMERLAIGVACLGMAKCAFADAARYANATTSQGQSMGSFQLVQEKITNMYLRITSMQYLLYRIAWQMDENVSTRLMMPLSKLYCAREGFAVLDDAMQVLGGQGYQEGHRVFRYWKELRGHRLGGGTDEDMIQAAGKQILRQYQA